MSVLLHPPAAITFEGEVSEDDRRRISKAIGDAVRRALTNAAAGSRGRVGQPSTGEVSERLDPDRLDHERALYQVPSYQDEGRPTTAKVLQTLAPEMASGVVVYTEPGPLEGALIARLQGNRYVNLRSARYASAGTLTEALIVGDRLFATSSFAIVQGPIGAKTMRYLAAATDPSVADADLGEKAGNEIPPELQGVPGELVREGVRRVVGEEILGSLIAKNGEYLIRGLLTKDRRPHWRNAGIASQWFAQLAQEQQRGITGPDPEVARVIIFDDIDALVDQIEAGDDSHLQKAADLLSKFDAGTFALVDWETKVRYLKVLLAAWTWEEQEKAVVEIFKSLKDTTELNAVVALLKKAGRYDQLFNDLDSQLYDLLVAVGHGFARDRGPFTLRQLLDLVESMGLITEAMRLASPLGPAGTLIGSPQRLIDEAHEAASSLLRFVTDAVEALIMLVTETGKVFEGIAALAKLLVEVSLAQWGYPPAIEHLSELLTQLGQRVLEGMRGADALGAGEKVLRRLKWRLIWEIASMFIGVGEIKATIAGAQLGEKLAGVVRFLAVLLRLGEAVEEEADATRVARLAALLRAERTAFASVEEAAELLSHLPEDDVRKLGRLLKIHDLKEGETLAQLAARSTALHGAVEDAMAKAELLKALAAKSGGLGEDTVRAFATLVGRDGMEVNSAARVVAAIPEAEGARFAAALERVPLGRLTADARAALMETLAGNVKRMDAVTRLGFDTFNSVYRRAAGHADSVDRYLAAIDRLEAGFGEGKQAEFRRFLDALERDEPAAWLKVENERRILAGERPIGGWAELLGGSPRAQSALDKLLRRRGEGVVDSLIDQLGGHQGLISDSEVVLALEKLDELGPRELDGVLELQRYLDRGEHLPQWDEILFTEDARRRELLEVIGEIRDPANPGRVVIQDGMGEVLEAALRQRNVQGGMAHFQAVRGLLRDFPGATFRLEVTRLSGGWREVDIVMNVSGRTVDVEVKGYQVTTALDHVRRQIGKDLVSHLGDAGGPFSNMLWRFADPMYAANFPTVERIFLEELGKLGLSPGDLARAEAALRGRFTAPPPWRLIDVVR